MILVDNMNFSFYMSYRKARRRRRVQEIETII